MLNHIITKTICKHLPGQGGDGHASCLPFQDVPEVFEIRVPTSHSAVLELEGGDVSSAYYFVVGVHVARRPVRHGVFDLHVREIGLVDVQGECLEREEQTSISRKFSGGP